MLNRTLTGALAMLAVAAAPASFAQHVSTSRLEVRIPGQICVSSRNPCLNVRVEVPLGPAAAIEDPSDALEPRGSGDKSGMLRSDGSGTIRVHNVVGSVVVRRVASTGIRDTGGDFVVEHDGTGGSYRHIAGTVRTPEREP